MPLHEALRLVQSGQADGRAKAGTGRDAGDNVRSIEGHPMTRFTFGLSHEGDE